MTGDEQKFGVRRQQRCFELPGLDSSTLCCQSKAASRYACRRTPNRLVTCSYL
jgi:hypothetical protein